MNQDILNLLANADDFTKKVLLEGVMRNCEFWGKKAAERVFTFEEKLNAAIERDMNDAAIESLQTNLDQAQAQLTTLRSLYRACNKEIKG